MRHSLVCFRPHEKLTFPLSPQPWILERFLSAWKTAGKTRSRSVILGLCFSGSLVILIQVYFYNQTRRRRPIALKALHEAQKHSFDDEGQDFFDVCIVGAGPAGSSCAFYLAGAGVRVLLLERSTFPRDKVCGDVLSAEVLSHLKDMGVWQRILERGSFRWLNDAGLVAGGVEESSVMGRLRSNRPLSIQRIVLDEELAAAACGAGAVLQERANVVDIGFADCKWRLVCSDGREFSSRYLVAADGAESKLSRMAGVVTDVPNAWGKRCYVRPQDGARMQGDYVVQYGPSGPLSVVREVEDFLLVSQFSKRDEGDDEESGASTLNDILRTPKRTPWVTCPMRVGGLPKIFGNQFLAIGDAAGQCDPLTGHGILSGMKAAKLAALTIVEVLVDDSVSIAEYQARVERDLHFNYRISDTIASTMGKYPSVMEATVSLVKRRGAIELSRFFSGYHSNTAFFLAPSIWGMILLEAVRNTLAGTTL